MTARGTTWVAVSLLPPALLLAGEGGVAPDPGFAFVDAAAEAGLTTPTICGLPDKPSILDGTGPGVGMFDYDGDGRLDLYQVQGGITHDPGPVHAPDVLYRNRGGWRFTDVTAAAGVGEKRYGHGCLAADLDGDGDTDIYLSQYGRNTFFRNRDDGTFEDATEAAGLGDERWGTGVTAADIDRDGDLDVYVANYVAFDPKTTPRLGNARCTFLGVLVFCGPRGLTPVQGSLYRNRGDGTFEDATRAAGMWREEPYYGLGAMLTDIDDDGDPDLYVADDATPHLLYINRGDGTFTEEGLLRGVAFSQDGAEQAGMGTDAGDYNGDGRFDIIVTTFSHDTNTLYRNDGDRFEVVTFAAGLGESTLPQLGWGTAFQDFDGDGWQDLFFANGHVYPQMDGRGLGTAYRQTNQVFRNRGDGTFEDVSSVAGPGMAVEESSRGAAFGDLDDDGDPDVFVTNLDAPPTLLRNERRNGARWLGLRIRGRGLNPDAIGARAWVETDGRRQVREVRAGSSYLSTSDPRLLFGLGTAARVERVEVRWPDGSRARFEGLAPDLYHQVSPPAPGAAAVRR